MALVAWPTRCRSGPANRPGLLALLGPSGSRGLLALHGFQAEVGSVDLDSGVVTITQGSGYAKLAVPRHGKVLTKKGELIGFVSPATNGMVVRGVNGGGKGYIQLNTPEEEAGVLEFQAKRDAFLASLG